MCKPHSPLCESPTWKNQSFRQYYEKTTADDLKMPELSSSEPGTIQKMRQSSSSKPKKRSSSKKINPTKTLSTLSRQSVSFDDSSTSTSRRAPRRKTVSFGEEPTIVPIEHYKKIPKRELSKRWWSEKDFISMQHDTNACVHLMEMGVTKADDDPDFTTRGLERLTEIGMTQFLEDRRDATIAVLEVQQQVNKQKSFRNARQTPDEIIAYAYRMETKRSQKKAEVQGQKDAKEVEDYLADCDAEKILQEQQKEAAAASKQNGKRPSFFKRLQKKCFSTQ